MPRWDFRCETCDRTHELVFRTVEDAADARCPQCGGKLTRQPAAPSFAITGYTAKNGYAKSTR